ncbi:hypothetical protein ACHAPG_011366 [Botrytis cinerea]
MSISNSLTNINANMNPLFNSAHNQRIYQDIQTLNLPYFNNDNNSHSDPQQQHHQRYNSPAPTPTQPPTPTITISASTSISYHTSNQKNKITKLSQKAKLRKQASYHKKSRSRCYDVADLSFPDCNEISFQFDHDHSSSTASYPLNASSYLDEFLDSNSNTPRELTTDKSDLESAMKFWDENLEVSVSNSALGQLPKVDQSQAEEESGDGMGMGIGMNMEGCTGTGNDEVPLISIPIAIYSGLNFDIPVQANAEQQQTSLNQMDDAYLTGLTWTEYLQS